MCCQVSDSSFRCANLSDFKPNTAGGCCRITCITIGLLFISAIVLLYVYNPDYIFSSSYEARLVEKIVTPIFCILGFTFIMAGFGRYQN